MAESASKAESTPPPSDIPAKADVVEAAQVERLEEAVEAAKPVSEVPKDKADTTTTSMETKSEKTPGSIPKAESKAPEPEPEATPPAPEEAPDPDEDDLSDLDDVLDEFTPAKETSKPTPTSSGPGRPSTLPSDTTTSKSAPTDPTSATLPDDDEFARSLQAGMAELLGELESSPEMQKQFEELVKELGDGVAAVNLAEPSEVSAIGGGGSGSGVSRGVEDGTTVGESGSSKAEASFQETIRATMERMSASNTAATSATQAPTSGATTEDDFLAAMLREMEAGGGGGGAGAGGPGGGAGGDEDFSKMLLGMMEQLTNKDILYEPMKELHDKFPEWLVVNRARTDKGDLERYEEQQRLVGEIVGKFEEKGYADDKVEYREFIVDKMQKMQAAGSPPPDLVGDMNAAQEAMGEMDAGCPQQ